MKKMTKIAADGKTRSIVRFPPGINRVNRNGLCSRMTSASIALKRQTPS
jgi:hypothetical protein